MITNQKTDQPTWPTTVVARTRLGRSVCVDFSMQAINNVATASRKPNQAQSEPYPRHDSRLFVYILFVYSPSGSGPTESTDQLSLHLPHQFHHLKDQPQQHQEQQQQQQQQRMPLRNQFRRSAQSGVAGVESRDSTLTRDYRSDKS